MKTKHWLVKSEPESYSWETFVRDSRTAWTGVRNYAARNNLQAMHVGDRVFFYESMGPKCIQGLAEVVATATPDKTADEPGWVSVELRADRPLSKPVSLAQIKADSALADMALLRQSRLSVVPLTAAEFKRILQLSSA